MFHVSSKGEQFSRSRGLPLRVERWPVQHHHTRKRVGFPVQIFLQITLLLLLHPSCKRKRRRELENMNPLQGNRHSPGTFSREDGLRGGGTCLGRSLHCGCRGLPVCCSMAEFEPRRGRRARRASSALFETRPARASRASSWGGIARIIIAARLHCGRQGR